MTTQPNHPNDDQQPSASPNYAELILINELCKILAAIVNRLTASQEGMPHDPK